MSTQKKTDAPIESKLVAAALGTLATMVAKKAITASWKSITGEEPPDPTDPEASTVQTIAWAAASALGLAVTQVLVSKFASKRFGSIPRIIKD